MLATYAASQYQENEVQTTPGKLIVMLYDGAIRFLGLAGDALRRGDLETRALNLAKAERILCELNSCLDMRAGDLAAHLSTIYRYCLARLVTAHVEDQAEYIEEVIRHLGALRDSWDAAERSLRAAQYEAPVLTGANR